MALVKLLILVLLAPAGAEMLKDMEQGAEFTKCIKITDLETKTLDDDITLVDRESSGCCPDDSVPGVKYYNNYQGAQIVCGFKDDGTVALSTGSSGGTKTCTYNKCYVMKQNLECKDGTFQRLNGCCGAKPQTNFKAECLFYDKSFTSAYSDTTNYCLTYHKNYKMESTSDKADDIEDGKLQVGNLYTYTACAGGSPGGGSSGSAPSAASLAAPRGAAAGAASLVAAAVLLRA